MKDQELENPTYKLQISTIKLILDEAESIQDGSITIIFQDAMIIQINKYEKFSITG